MLEIMKNRFGMETLEPCLNVKYTPSEKDLEECRGLGKRVAEKLLR